MLSIIMSAYKRPHLLAVGLESINKQKIKTDYEIIVLNDGVEDGSREISESHGARYFFTGQRNSKELIWRTPGFALNIGAKQAKGDLILLTSPEIYYLTDNCLNTMVELCYEKPKTLAIPEFGYDDISGITSNRIISGLPTDITREPVTLLNVGFPFCLMMKKHEFYVIGGYDEEFIGFAYEDADLVRRLLKNGCTYKKAENHKILHLFHGSRTNFGREGLKNRQQQLDYNLNLYNQRENIIKRNVNKSWGVL